MIACAFGPGSGVLMFGVIGPLLALPSGACRVVFQKHAACREILPNAVGGAEVAAAAGGMAILDQPLDLLDRHRRPGIFRLTKADDAEHLVEAIECVLGDRDVGL